MGKRKKYAALFSCLVLVTALGAGIAGSRSAKREQERQRAANEAALLNEEVQTVDVNKNMNPNGVNYNSKNENGSVNEYYNNTDTMSKDFGESPDNANKTQESKPTDIPKSEPAKENITDTQNKKQSSAEETDNEEFVLADTGDAKPVFNWPVNGDVVMDFSSDALVYDSTLDQYRTNSNICISAPKGTAVKAAASGTVESVAYNDENGYTVTIFHGNGWRTTYGQLDKNTAVSQGDIIKTGDVIGTVAAPTKYSINLGDHLEFAVLEDTVAIDPKVALAE